jgi:uncharacterized OB-fold protein
VTQPLEGKAPSVWRGEIPIQSYYTAGLGGQIFFQALKQDGKLIGTRCVDCAQVYLPARSFCERCFAKLTEEVEVGRTGRLVSYTICYGDRDRLPLNPPLALGLVQLDRATTVLLHYLLGVKNPAAVKIGSQVQAVIKPRSKRIGSILDIEGFRLL